MTQGTPKPQRPDRTCRGDRVDRGLEFVPGRGRGWAVDLNLGDVPGLQPNTRYDYHAFIFNNDCCGTYSVGGYAQY